jgi:hypothetical protein
VLREEDAGESGASSVSGRSGAPDASGGGEEIPVEIDFAGETADIRNALPALEGELKDRWLSIAGAVFVEEWRHFAEELYGVGEEYRLPGLRQYAKMILDNVRDFHLQELKELVGSYPALVLQYRRRVE